MAILATLRKDGFGKWTNLQDYLSDVRLRETGSIAALAAVLSAEPADQKELGAGEGAVYMVDLASDLRVPKGARLAATRCAMEAGLKLELLAELFLGAGDLVTDPRLGGAAKKLAEQGIAAAAQKPEGAKKISDLAGAFARAAHAASSVLGSTRVKELLAAAPPSHAGVSAAVFALGGELLQPEREAWQKLLNEQCAKNRKAPAAAKRMGLVPSWPPFLPEAFAPLIKAAEEANANVSSSDALALTPPPMTVATAAAQGSAGSGGPPLPSIPGGAVLTPPGALAGGAPARKLEAPIRPRRPLNATVSYGPVQRPQREMPAVTARPTATPAAGEKKDAPKQLTVAAAGALAGASRKSSDAAKAPAPKAGDEPLRFDPNGRRLSRVDRFNGDEFQWQDPILPSPALRVVARATIVDGPFAQRVLSIFDDRPEAVDRLCAAAEARVQVHGAARAEDELARELKLARWTRKPTPPGQLLRLSAIAANALVPAPWREAAQAILARPVQEL